MGKIRIVLSGGHFSAALGIIEELEKRHSFDITYIGRSHVLEQAMCKKRGIPFFLLSGTTFSLFQIPGAVWHSISLLRKIRTHIVVGFGGYVSLPIGLAAFLLRIPILLHEQTVHVGRTNRILARLPNVRLCLSWDHTQAIPRSVSRIVTGPIIRQSFFLRQNSSVLHFGNEKLPLLYITGGSLGAQTLNAKVLPAIARIVQKFRILHQCGSSDNDRDFHMLLSLKNTLPRATKSNYKVIKHVEPEDVGPILRNAACVISRSGANTIAELAAVGTPALLVPLPWAADNEQEKNALYLARQQDAIVVQQKNLTSDIILSTVSTLSTKKTQRQNLLPNGAKRFVDEIEYLCKGTLPLAS